MKCTVPEISWHNRDPVLSLDIHLNSKNLNGYKVATGGNDCHVVVWQVMLSESDPVVEALADLSHHLKPVNAVRFAPTDDIQLASADDDGHIIIWRRQTQPDIMCDVASEADGVHYREHYSIAKTLRGHLQDVYDLSWSADGTHLVSGAVDNTAIMWDVQKGVKLKMLDSHDSFVQGVAWDPLNRLVATLSCDRFCRVFNVHNGKCVARVQKAKLPCKTEDGSEIEKSTRLFHDDTLQTFCRRLTFSPDGLLLLAPAGILDLGTSKRNAAADQDNTAGKEKPAAKEKHRHADNVVHVFSRHDFSKPIFCFPTGDKYTIAVRCCPTLFRLRMRVDPDPSRPLWEQTHSMLKLPYRMVIAVATKCSVLLYDTQQQLPFACISNIHFTRLTDITWSRDGRLLMISSTDGFCSIVTFESGELGEVYSPDSPLKVPGGEGNSEKEAKKVMKPETDITPEITGSSENGREGNGIKVQSDVKEKSVACEKSLSSKNTMLPEIRDKSDRTTIKSKPTMIAVKRKSKPSEDILKSTGNGTTKSSSIEKCPSPRATSSASAADKSPRRAAGNADHTSDRQVAPRPRTPVKDVGTPRRVPLVTLSSPHRPAAQRRASAETDHVDMTALKLTCQDDDGDTPMADTASKTEDKDSDVDEGAQLVLHMEETTRELDEAMPASPRGAAASGAASSAAPPPPSPKTPRRVQLITLSSPKRRTPAKDTKHD